MAEETNMLLEGQPEERLTSEELLPLVYRELRRLASHKLLLEQPGQTLSSTALVHEAWLRLGASDSRKWESRKHFFMAAARAMRRILIENSRRKHRQKRGGEFQRVEMDAVEISCPLPDEDLLALDEALDQLAKVDAVAGELVSLRFFTGLTQAEAAAQLGISRSTADRTWVFARAWLYHRVRLPEEPGKENTEFHPIS